MKKYILKIKHYIALQVICDLISTVALAFLPYLIKLLFDYAYNLDLYLLLKLTLYFLSLVLISIIFSYFNSLFSWKAGITFEISLKRDFFKALSNYSYQRFKKNDIGEYIAIQSNEITTIEQDYLTPLINIFQSIIQILGYGIVLFVYIDWRIGIVIVSISTICSIIAPQIGAKELSERRKEYLDYNAKYFSKIKDFLEGFKLINKITKSAFYRKHDDILHIVAKKRYQYGKLKSFLLAIKGLFLYFVNISSFVIVGILLYLKQISIGAGVAAFGYIESFVSPIQWLTYDFSAIKSTKDIRKKVIKFLSYEKDDNLIEKKDLNSSIDFKNVNIHFDNFKLSNFTYSFKKGKKYAIIGQNGSGKSTVINALMKYIDVDSGDILIDNVRNELLDTSQLIWCISQDEHIFSAPFIENATIFKTFQNDGFNHVQKIIEKDRIEKIKDQKNSQLLSGGEKQIIKIIRSLNSLAKVIILDESFSAMDISNNLKITDMILKMKEKTVILITHKITDYLNKFDEVIFINDGKLICAGHWLEVKKNKNIQLLLEKNF